MGETNFTRLEWLTDGGLEGFNVVAKLDARCRDVVAARELMTLMFTAAPGSRCREILMDSLNQYIFPMPVRLIFGTHHQWPGVCSFLSVTWRSYEGRDMCFMEFAINDFGTSLRGDELRTPDKRVALLTLDGLRSRWRIR